MPARIRMGALGAIIAALMIAPSAIAAEYVSALVGGGGGTAYNRDCGSNRVLIGLQGKWGFWFDQLTPVCQAIAADGTLGEITTLSRVGGAGGNNAGEKRCTAGRVLAGFKASWGTYVDRLRLSCVTWMPATKARGTTILDPPPTLGSTGLLKSETHLFCASGKLAKGIRGKAASYVDSLSLVCNAWNQ